MRKDTKTGLITGSVICLVLVVWFCTKQQVIEPMTETQPPKQTVDDLAAAETTSISFSKPARVIEEPSYQKPAKPKITQAPKPAPSKSVVIHTVLSGQTLSNISQIYYGSPHKWERIYKANKKQFPRGPNAIKPGAKIIIPQ